MAIEWPYVIHCGMPWTYHIRGIFFTQFGFALLFKWKSICLLPLFYIEIKQKHIFFSRHDRVIFRFFSILKSVFAARSHETDTELFSRAHSGSDNNNDYDDDVEDEKWMREKGVLLYKSYHIQMNKWYEPHRMGWSQKQANNKIKQKKEEDKSLARVFIVEDKNLDGDYCGGGRGGGGVGNRMELCTLVERGKNETLIFSRRFSYARSNIYSLHMWML